jgi:hypothetical protein
LGRESSEFARKTQMGLSTGEIRKNSICIPGGNTYFKNIPG